MAYIAKTRDPFHSNVFVCSNCKYDLFMYEHNNVNNLQSVTLFEISKEKRPLKQIPCLCGRCLEPLELKEGVLNFKMFEEGD